MRAVRFDAATAPTRIRLHGPMLFMVFVVEASECQPVRPASRWQWCAVPCRRGGDVEEVAVACNHKRLACSNKTPTSGSGYQIFAANSGARRLPGSKAPAPARSARSTGSAASSRAKSSCERLEARRRLSRPCSTSPLRRSAGKTFDLLKMVEDFVAESYPIAIRQSYQQG